MSDSWWVNWNDNNFHTIATQDDSGTFLTVDSLGNASMKPYLTQSQTSGETQQFKKLITKSNDPIIMPTIGQLQDNQGRCFGKNLQFSKGACGPSGQISFDPFIQNEFPNIGYASMSEIYGGGKQLLCMNPQGYLTPPDIFQGKADQRPECVWINKETVVECCTNPGTSKSCGGWRSGTGGSCIEFMLNYCTENNWNDPQGVCNNYINNPALPADAKLVVHDYVLQYVKDQPYNSQDPVYKNVIPYLCSRPNVFGVCDDVLNNFCSSYSRDDLEKDETLQVLCGCHLQPKDYPYSGWGIPSSCDSICLYENTIQNSSYQKCQSNSCIIDNVTVDIINSEVDNGINFGQVCGSCGSHSGSRDGTNPVCECWLSGININDINSIIKGGINLQQSCGGKCFYVPSGQDPRLGIPVDCDTLEPKGCTNNSQCPSGQECKSGKCVNIGKCTSNADCPQNQICHNGKCTRQCGKGDNECFLGEICVDGICVNNKTGCTNDAQCQPGWKCESGQCEKIEKSWIETILDWVKGHEFATVTIGIVIFIVLAILIFLIIKHYFDHPQ